MVTFIGYEFSPNMMGIQEGYTKNFHIKCIDYYDKFDSLLFNLPQSSLLDTPFERDTHES